MNTTHYFPPGCGVGGRQSKDWTEVTCEECLKGTPLVHAEKCGESCSAKVLNGKDLWNDDWTKVTCEECIKSVPIPSECPSCKGDWTKTWNGIRAGHGNCAHCKARYDVKLTPWGLAVEPLCPRCAGSRSCDVCTAPAPEAVNHPQHYNLPGLDVTAIDVIEAVCQGGPVDFHLGNALKYIIRAGQKGGPDTQLQDVRKAVWYLQRAADTLEKQ